MAQTIIEDYISDGIVDPNYIAPRTMKTMSSFLNVLFVVLLVALAGACSDDTMIVDPDNESKIENSDYDNETFFSKSPKCDLPEDERPDNCDKGGGGSDGGDTAPPDPAAIVFSDFNDIKVINSDGSNETVVFNNGARVWRPRWDFAGARVAFTQSSGELWIINVDGLSGKALVSDPTIFAGAPAFSPDGSSIVFRNGRDQIGNLRIVNSLGGESSVLYESGTDFQAYSPVYSPDGRLAFVKRGVSTDGHFEYSIEILIENGTETVLEFGNFTGIGRIDWANTSDSILFAGKPPNGKESNVYVLDLSNGSTQQLTSHGGGRPAYSSDDTQVVYEKGFGLKVLTLATGESTRVSRRGTSPDWKN